MTTQRERGGRASPGAAVPVAVDFVENSSLAAPSAPHDTDVATLSRELAALRAEFAAFRTAQMSPAMLSPGTSLAADAHGVADAAAEITKTPTTSVGAPTSATSVTSRRSRRSLLKWGGVGAAAALAATGGSALTTQTAHAASGGTMVLGQYNVAETNSKIALDTTTSGLYGLIVDAETSPEGTGIWAIGGDEGIAVKAQLYGNGGYGVYSTTVNGVGIYATSTTPGGGGWGVQGVANGGTGVYGYSQNGFAVSGESRDFISLCAAGTGRFLQVLTASAGAPTSGQYNTGEQIRDQNGDLYICVATGTPGTWRKVAAGVPGVSGAITFLANPIRLLDTSSGLGTSGTAPWTAGSTHTLQVTGVAVGGVSVPAGAIGVLGNITVFAPSAAGSLSVYPGPTVPSTSTISFASGWTIANSVTSGLNSSGQFIIAVGMPTGKHTHVLFDANAYIM